MRSLPGPFPRVFSTRSPNEAGRVVGSVHAPGRHLVKASWPLHSIVLLCALSVIAPPIVLTVMHASLIALAVIVAAGSNQRIDSQVWHVVVPFALMITIGSASGAGAEPYAYAKDAWYMLNPLLVVLAGYVLFKARPDIRAGLGAFAIAGALVAVWQLRFYAYDPGLLMLPAVSIRERIGNGSYPPVLGLAILLIMIGRWRESLPFQTWVGVSLGLLMGIAVAGMFSRTAIFIMLIAVGARAGCFARNEWLRMGLPALGVALLLLLMESMWSATGGRDLQSFFGKLMNSVRELALSNPTTLGEINTNFRGYESARAFSQFLSGSIVEIFFGQGFGALVDLGLFMPLGDREGGMTVRMWMVPTLHNGYLYLLIKGGVVSVLLYLYVLGYLYWKARGWANMAVEEPRRLMGRLFQAIVLTVAFTTYVIGGVFNKSDMVPFLLAVGYLLAFMGHQGEG